MSKIRGNGRGESFLKTNRASAHILYAVTMLFWFSQYAYVPYLNPELEKLGVSASFMGFVGGMYGLVQLVLRLPLGITADRLGRQKLFICIGCLCSALSSIAVLLAYHPVAFLICRVLGGVAASSWVAFTVLYSSYFDKETASRSITLLNVGNQLGRLSSYVLGAYFVGRFGAGASFALAAAGGSAALLLSLFIKDTKPSGTPVQLSQLVSVLRDRNLIVCSLLGIMIQTVSFATIYSFSSNYAVSIGAEQSQLSVMNIALIIPYTIGNFAAGAYLMRRVRVRWLLFAGFAAAAAYCAVLPSIRTISLLYVAQGGMGLGVSLVFPVLMGVCVQNIEPEKKSTAMGFFQAIYGLGMTMGPVLMGIVTQWSGLRGGFYLIACLGAASALGSLWLLRERKTPAGAACVPGK